MLFRSPTRPKRPSTVVEAAKIVAGSVLGLVVGYLIICWIRPQSDFLRLFCGQDQGTIAQAPQPTLPANPTTQKPISQKPTTEKKTPGGPPSAAPAKRPTTSKPVAPALPRRKGDQADDGARVGEASDDNKRDDALRAPSKRSTPVADRNEKPSTQGLQIGRAHV